MRPRALVAIAAAIVVGVTALTSITAWALLTTTTAATQSVTTATLGAPSGLTATPLGHDVALAWSAGQSGTGYQILGTANGSNPNCSGATFSALTSTTNLAYSDSGRYGPQGGWYCYQVQTSNSTWTSTTNPSVAVQLGVVATSLSITNGGNSGKLDTGDQIAITFNQPIDTSTGPGSTDSVCSTGSNTILLATTVASGSCSTSESVNVGTLSGGTQGTNARFAATNAWSNANKTLTITLGTRTSGSGNTFASGAWTLNPTTTSTKLQSATGAFHACDTNTGGGFCLPSASGSF
jgi:hypothetical protein